VIYKELLTLFSLLFTLSVVLYIRAGVMQTDTPARIVFRLSLLLNPLT